MRNRLLYLLLLMFSISAVEAEPQQGAYRLTADKQQAEQGDDSVSTPPGYVFDITVQNEQQLSAILQRAESLQGQFTPDQHGRITLVLHGDELRFFQKSNYAEFMGIVDQARQLDQQNLIDIKACQTAMDFYQIEQSELPGFIEQVPLAPVEIERLQREKDYTRL